jgi:hypothetical protein
MARRIAALAALALAASGCSKSPCQELGERICRCQPGMTEDTCKTQVQGQLDGIDTTSSFEDFCQQRLDACNAPQGADFCEWLATADGKDACGLTPANPAP